MKRLSATEARKEFFRLLDSAVKGEPVTIDRKGIALRLVRESSRRKRRVPDYRGHILSPVDGADEWSWEWGPKTGLIPKNRSSR